MIKTSSLTFPSSDGIHRIAWTLWEPEGPVRCAVQLVHGVAEYIDRYHDFACFLCEHGIAVAGDDHLGHGRTAADASELGWFAGENGWKYLVEDEKRLRDLLRARFPRAPLVLFGHSMGSFMARTYLMEYPGDHDGCILSGTACHSLPVCLAGQAAARAEVWLHGSRYRSARLQAIAFSGYLRRVKDPASPNDWVCGDRAVVRLRDADPWCSYTPTAGLMKDMMDGLAAIAGKRGLSRMDKRLPVLFIAGGDDPVGGYGRGVRRAAALFRGAGMENVQVKLYPGLRHEILNEPDRQVVWNDVLDWLETKI